MELSKCERISYSQECGWAIAHGFDKHNNLIISVHAHTEQEIRDALTVSKAGSLAFD